MDLKRYIHEVMLDNDIRSSLVFSDPSKIRVYTDDRFGVRLRGVWDKNASRLKFPTENDITVELPLWNPDSVKGWLAFEELSSKPENTSIGWRVSDGTDVYWAKSSWPSDLALLIQYNESFTPDYYRDGVDPTTSTSGSPAIIPPGVEGFGDGALTVGGGGSNYVYYEGDQLGALKNTGTIRFRVKLNYSGFPDFDQSMFSMYNSSTFANVIGITHSVFGTIGIVIGDETGTPITLFFTPVWNHVAGQWYEFELVFDTTPGTGFGAVLRIDGVEFGSDSSTGSRSASAVDVYGFGPPPIGGDPVDLDIDEAHFYDTVQHVSDYVPATSEYEPPRVWEVVTPLDTEWNTEVQISENLPTFDHTTKKIKLIANLRTTDDSVTPVLDGSRLMMQAQFDYWEDLVIRTVRRKVYESFDFHTNYSAVMESAGVSFNYKTDQDWIPEQELNILDVDSVYNHDNDPDHFVDILDNVNTSTGEVTLTGSVIAGTQLFVVYVVRPKVVINFPNTDFYEVSKTPEIIIEVVTSTGRQVEASIWMADKARDKTYKMGPPKLFKMVTFNCIVWTGSIVDSMRLMSVIDSFTTGVGVIQSKALDIPYTLCERGSEAYNPSPNPTDLKQSSFQFSIEDFYVWPVVSDGHMVKNFAYSLNRRRDVGPNEEFDVTPSPLPAGVVPALYNQPDIEEG